MVKHTDLQIFGLKLNKHEHFSPTVVAVIQTQLPNGWKLKFDIANVITLSEV